MKKDILETFKKLHDLGSFVKFLNSSFLILIAKVEGAINMKYFRLVSLVGSVYKLTSKVLAKRMSKVMDKVATNVDMFLWRADKF